MYVANKQKIAFHMPNHIRIMLSRLVNQTDWPAVL